MIIISSVNICVICGSLSSLFLFPRLLLSEHHHAIDEVCHPLLGETKATVVLTDGDNGLEHVRLLEVVLVKDVVDGLLSHRVESLLHKARQTELELHQVARQHHDVLREALELQEIGLCVLYLLTTTMKALVDLLEKASSI